MGRGCAALAIVICSVCAVRAQDFFQKPKEGRPAIPIAVQTANTNPTYKALRTIGMGEIVPVKGFVLKRDAATFTLDGVVAFLAPVNGRVTGAAFFGRGTLDLLPPIEVERKSLAELTKAPSLHEEFEQALFRFTDNTLEETRQNAAHSAGPISTGDAMELLHSTQRYLKKEGRYNLDGRLLEDVLGGSPGGLFWAFISGKKVSKKILFAIDPHGLNTLGLAPEEVALYTYESSKEGIWAAFHFSREYETGQARGSQNNLTIDIEHQSIDLNIEKSGAIAGIAQTTFVSRVDGLRVVPFNLFRSLRVRNVLDVNGNPLDFIQENKDEDADFSVILSAPLARGERTTLTTAYSGTGALLNVGSGDYYLVETARDSWYPSSNFGDYAAYDMTFHAPQGLTLVATGTPGPSHTDADKVVTEWKSEVPQAVAGFNIGNYKKEEAVPKGMDYKIEAYANVKSGSYGSVLKREVGEGQIAVPLYTEYFGPAPYKRLALTEHPTNAFGQSWPALIYLPYGSFKDSYGTAVNALSHGFWRTVAPHEIAHQWFGHTVGILSYRDNWLSEGFAQFAASLYLQYVYSNQPDTYRDFLKEWRSELLQKNSMGKRPVDVGSVTMGYRLGNSKVGLDVNRLIYAKGGYILHMLRMMMWNPQDGDAAFKEMMHDYVHSNSDRLSSTEDFKDAIERHMTREMNQTGDGKMDWFFNQFVYGTALPDYRLESTFTPIANGFTMNLKISQSNVDEKFVMPVPVYLDFGNNKIVKVGAVRLAGNASTSASVPLTGISEPPKRVLLNYNFDILCTENGR